MQKTEFLGLHRLFYEIADYMEVDFEDTEYEEYGVGPVSIYREKEEHKEAIRLISKLLEEQTELGVEELETWHEDSELDRTKYCESYGPENPL